MIKYFIDCFNEPKPLVKLRQTLLYFSSYRELETLELNILRSSSYSI